MRKQPTLPPFPPQAIVHAHAVARAGGRLPPRPSAAPPAAAPPAAPTPPAAPPAAFPPSRTREAVVTLATRVDELTAQSRATARVLELLVTQMVQVTDSVGALTQRLVELNTLPGLAPRSPPPLVPAFEQPPVSSPLANPPTRRMREWEKLALAKLLRSGRLSRSQRNGVVALLEPELTHAVLADADERVYTFDVYTYDDYRLWKLWHYLVVGTALDGVLTEAERRAVAADTARGGHADRGRPPSRGAVQPKKRPRSRAERDADRAAAEAGAALETSRSAQLVALGQKAERAVVQLAAEGLSLQAELAAAAAAAPAPAAAGAQ